MSRHTRTAHPQPTPTTPAPKKTESQRTDTAGTPRPTAQAPATKISDARSQANPMQLTAPPLRLTADERNQMIQMRAYYLWEQAGRPDGDSDRERFWFQAEREVGGIRPTL